VASDELLSVLAELRDTSAEHVRAADDCPPDGRDLSPELLAAAERLHRASDRFREARRD
jgi:hypothetical protein